MVVSGLYVGFHDEAWQTEANNLLHPLAHAWTDHAWNDMADAVTYSILLPQAYAQTPDPDAFVTTWNVTRTPVASTINAASVRFSIGVAPGGQVTIDWGNGNSPKTYNATGYATNAYLNKQPSTRSGLRSDFEPNSPELIHSGATFLTRGCRACRVLLAYFLLADMGRVFWDPVIGLAKSDISGRLAGRGRGIRLSVRGVRVAEDVLQVSGCWRGSLSGTVMRQPGRLLLLPWGCRLFRGACSVSGNRKG